MFLKPKEKVILTIAFFLLCLDRLAKIAALKLWTFQDFSITPWLKLTLAINKNIAFSLPLSGHLLNFLLLLIILALFYYWLSFLKSKQSLAFTLLSVIIMSSASNAFDRLVYGGVIDYISLQYFTVFNLADAAICVSTFAAAFHLLKSDK